VAAEPLLFDLRAARNRLELLAEVPDPETRDSRACGACGGVLVAPRRGPQPEFCSARCRQRARRAKTTT
jgi:hypothetical protein